MRVPRRFEGLSYDLHDLLAFAKHCKAHYTHSPVVISYKSMDIFQIEHDHHDFNPEQAEFRICQRVNEIDDEEVRRGA